MLAVPKGLTWGCFAAPAWKGSGLTRREKFLKGYSPSQALAVICGLTKRLERRDPLDIDLAAPSSISQGYLIGLDTA